MEAAASAAPAGPFERSTLGRAWRFAYDEVVYNGHLQTWGAVAIVIVAAALLGAPTSSGLLLVVYLLFYLIYLHDRYRGMRADEATNARRSRHMQKIYQFVPAILVGGLALLAALVYAWSNLRALAFVAAVVLGGFLYPIYFKGLTRNITAFKNMYVALVFALLVAFPNLYDGSALTGRGAEAALLLALFVFLRGLTMQILLDLKDIEGDAAEGLRTLGVLFGRERTLALLRWLNVLTALALPALYLALPAALPAPALFLAFTAVGYAYCRLLAARGDAAGFILASGEFVSWPVLVYLGQLALGR